MRIPGGHAMALAALAIALVPHTASAADSVFGRWASDPARCEDAGAVLAVSEKALHRPPDRCTIGKVYKVGRALYVQARCAGRQARSSIAVTLDLLDLNRLAVTWDKSPVEQMTRCR